MGRALFLAAKPLRQTLSHARSQRSPGLSSLYPSLHETCVTTIQDRFQAHLTDRARNEFFFEQILPATVAYLDEGLIERVRALQPDVIVCDVSTLWGILAAKFLKVPLITSCSCTLFEATTKEAIFSYLRDLPVSKLCVSWLQSELGIAYDACDSYMNESDFLISWSLAALQPPSRRKSPNVHFFGAALDANVEQAVEAAINPESPNQDSSIAFIQKALLRDPKTKVIYCTLGTVVGQEPWTILDVKEGEDMVGSFYKRVLACFGNKPSVCLVLSIGANRSIKDLGNIPTNVHVANHVPQLAILKLADVFMTHCGNNGVHEAFYFGCPMLCIPVIGDQHPNAASIERMQAGVQIASPFCPDPSPNLDHVTTEAMRDGVNQILESKDIRKACNDIRHMMMSQHKLFHQKALEDMESFIAAETQRLSADAVAKEDSIGAATGSPEMA